MISPIQYQGNGLINVSGTVNNIMNQQTSEGSLLSGQVSDYQTNISDYGQYQSALSTLQTSSQALTDMGLSSTLNPSDLTTNITNFVNAYNTVQTLGNNLNNSTFSDNSLVTNMGNNLTATLNTSQAALSNSTYNNLGQIGITAQADGTLAIDTTALNTAISTNASNVEQLFTNNGNGIADSVNNQLQGTLGYGGVISSDISSLNQGLNSIQNNVDQSNYAQSLQTDTLTAQYNALNSYLSVEQSTSMLLTDQQQAQSMALEQSLLTTPFSSQSNQQGYTGINLYA